MSLVSQLASKHLLKHPFYQAWSDGSLPRETLALYAAQYAKHVQAFPRYVSATHSKCTDLKTRQMLLENLIDEERGEENHPELWARFAEGVGTDRERLASEPAMASTDALVDTFVRLTQSSYEEGLGALFAYEHQVPEVAHFKIEALKKHYALTDERTLSFFEVHRKADVYHTQALTEALAALPADKKAKAERAAQEAASALWKFLDGMPCGHA